MQLFDAILPDQLTIVVEGEPTAKQSTRFVRDGYIDKKGNRRFSYTDPEVKKKEDDYQWTAISQIPKGFKPWDCPIGVSISYIFPIPKGFSKKLTQFILGGGIYYKMTKPDLTDNLNKAYFDAFAGVIYTNDSRIVKKIAIKIYGEKPRAVFNFYKIEQ